MRLSIILPCRNEERYIGPCLDSILATEYPRDALEVLVVDGRSDDRTREIVKRYASRQRGIRLLDNPQGIVPTALNAGVRAARGDIIVRMDAHVLYPPDYLPRLIEALTTSGADNVGGCIVTLPAGPGPVARAIAIALAHPFGVGNSYFRVGASAPRWVDTVAFGCYRRDVFERIGLFDEELIRNQDDEFNHRLIRSGGRILLVPGAVCYYYARRSLAQLARMYFQYGSFKPLAAKKVGRVMTLRQLVPSAFLAALAGTAACALFWPPAGLLFGLIAGGYVAAAAGCAMPVARRHGVRCAFALVAAFAVLHASYGWGFLRGLASVVRGTEAGPHAAAKVPLSR